MISQEKKIAILCPTRNRRKSLDKLISSWRETTSGYSEILLGVDIDQVKEYKEFTTVSSDLVVLPYSRLEHIPKLNIMARACTDWYPIVCSIGDDFVFHTPGWEEKIISWHSENVGISYGDDKLQGSALPTCAFMNSSIVTALGFMAPPTLKHYYCDNFWLDLGIRLGKLQYFPDIVIEHAHWSIGKALKDDLYSESEKLMTEDQAAWNIYRDSQMGSDVEKILNCVV